MDDVSSDDYETKLRASARRKYEYSLASSMIQSHPWSEPCIVRPSPKSVIEIETLVFHLVCPNFSGCTSMAVLSPEELHASPANGTQ
jgi:hypothetical protein